MAKPEKGAVPAPASKADAGAQAPAVSPDYCAVPESFTLARSIGIIEGAAHRLFKKGETFVIGIDDQVISLLHRAGAVFERK